MRITYFFALLLLLQSCTKPTGFQKGEGGMLYQIHLDQPGTTINEMDYTRLSIIQRSPDGQITSNTNDYDNRPVIRFREESRFKGDFFAGIGLLSEGDSATFRIPAGLSEKERDKSQKAGKFIEYAVRVHKVIHRGKLSDSLFTKAIAGYELKEAEIAKAREPAKLNRYILINKLSPERSKTGLMYIVQKMGNGPLAGKNDTVEVRSTLMCLSGKVFDTNSTEIAKKGGVFDPQLPYKPMKFPLAMLNPTSAFYEALRKFPRGTKVRLLVPSKLAYGANSYRELQPYTPLLCDIEILNINKSSKN